MCMTTKEMNDTMAAYQEWKRVKEEAEANMEALKLKAIEFLNETESCEDVDKKGNPIRRFIGIMFKATYSPQEREDVDKTAVKKILSEEEYRKVSKISRYNVLRIS